MPMWFLYDVIALHLQRSRHVESETIDQ